MNPELLSALQPVAQRLQAILSDRPQLAGWIA